MGLDLTIRFPGGMVPGWTDIRTRLTQIGEAAPLRMIDGLPAFPDEAPADGWRELRLGFAAGMVTVRRAGETLTSVVWSNADALLLAARDRVAWACAAAGNGLLTTPSGEVPADAFARLVGLSPV